MSHTVSMPALGESVTEGTVTRWLKAVGDTVAVDEPLLEVSTDKVDTEIPSPVAGILLQIIAAEDATVEVGGALAVIGEAGEQATPPAPAAAEAPAPPVEAAPAGAPPAPAPVPEPAAAPVPDAVAAAPATPDTTAAGQPVDNATDVTMPALGESVTEGTVTRWLKSVGDDVAVDEPLLEVSTDKVDTEIPSPVAGTLLQIVAAEDATVEVGGVVARIGSAGSLAATPAAPSATPTPATTPTPAAPVAPPAEPDLTSSPYTAPAPVAPSAGYASPSVTIPSAPAEVSSAPAPTATAAAEPPPSPATAGGAAASGTYLTPLVRKLAAEQGVDLTAVTGTGVGGRIRKEDVLAEAERLRAEAAKAAARAAQPAPAAATASPPADASSLRGTTEKMSRLRKLVATRMVEALQTTAQLTTVVEVDVTRIAQLRARAKAEFEAREGARLTFLPFFALAAVEALKAYPKLNASIEGDAIHYHPSENLGVAVDTERGLVVPVIRDAGELNIAGLARKIADLAARTRANKVSPDELTGGTFTLTNTGSIGALFDTPIVPQPQVGILGTGVIAKRPMVMTDADGNDTIAVRHMMYLALSYDHQIVDGADAGRFLQLIKRRLEEGAFEADLGL